ncbi:MAG: hypothetical protein WA733_23870 [Methylocystis sp.]
MKRRLILATVVVAISMASHARPYFDTDLMPAYDPFGACVYMFRNAPTDKEKWTMVELCHQKELDALVSAGLYFDSLTPERKAFCLHYADSPKPMTYSRLSACVDTFAHEKNRR